MGVPGTYLAQRYGQLVAVLRLHFREDYVAASMACGGLYGPTKHQVRRTSP